MKLCFRIEQKQVSKYVGFWICEKLTESIEFGLKFLCIPTMKCVCAYMNASPRLHFCFLAPQDFMEAVCIYGYTYRLH